MFVKVGIWMMVVCEPYICMINSLTTKRPKFSSIDHCLIYESYTNEIFLSRWSIEFFSNGGSQ